MSAGLFGLLDDVAALARLAAASVDDIGAAAGRATAKAAGVVIDDTAVTPQYVHGITADRELPMIKRIAIGSLRNKLLFILPAALLLSQFLPWLLTPILMLGATYLCFEGAEKVLGRLHRNGSHDSHAAPTAAVGEDAERQMTAGAIRTDFILSAEIMVIALNEVADQAFVPRLIILVVVALVITVAVYGVVALIVKMDDIGLSLAQRSSRFVAEVRPWPGRRDAQGAGGAVGHRHRRDALGRRPHPARRCGRPSAGTGPTAWSTTARSTCMTPWKASAVCSPGWSIPGHPR